MTDELIKRCPFCGFQPEIDDPDFLYPVTSDRSVWGAHCPTPSGGCDASVMGESRADALAHWNRRVAAAALEAANARIAELEAAAETTVPDGWKLVPVEPTEEMVIAANEVEYSDDGITRGQIRAAIAAALAQPLEAQADELSLRAQYEDACIQANKNARDAERYRWLRDFNVRCKDGVDVKPPCEHVFASMYSHAVGTIPATRLVTGEELDRAIDAALSQKAGE